MVNVMLVDFRGFDTLAEITVLGVVALTVYALLRRFRPAAESIDIPLQQRAIPVDIATDLISSDQDIDTAKGYLLVPAVLVRAVLPIAAVIAVYLFMRGHNEPGGGFVAGLVLSTAFILQYIVSGTRWVETHMPLRPPIWIASGLLIATATGAGALLLGYPFLTTHTAHIAELGNRPEEDPVVFIKPTSALHPPGTPIVLPAHSSDVHYEAELVLLVGQGGKNIAEDKALKHIAGYGLGLDLTARDLQTKAKQGGLPWAVAKGFDCSATVTQFVPAEHIEHPHQLHLQPFRRSL